MKEGRCQGLLIPSGLGRLAVLHEARVCVGVGHLRAQVLECLVGQRVQARPDLESRRLPTISHDILVERVISKQTGLQMSGPSESPHHHTDAFDQRVFEGPHRTELRVDRVGQSCEGLPILVVDEVYLGGQPVAEGVLRGDGLAPGGPGTG